MTAVTLACPLCAGTIQVEASMAGQQVACPLCHGALLLPPAEVLAQFAQPQFQSPQGPQPPTQEQLFTLGCPVCNQPLHVTAAMSGQQVACPFCATPIIVPPLQAPVSETATTPTQAPVESSPPPAEHHDLASLLPPGADLSPPTTVAAPSASTTPPKTAPSKPREPSPADRLPPTRPSPASPPSVDRFPPGHSLRQTTSPANDRFPPGFGGSKPREEKPPEAKQPEPRDDRMPPRRRAPEKVDRDAPTLAASGTERQEAAPKIDERLPPARREPEKADTAAPMLAVPGTEPPSPAIDDLLPPGVMPPQSEPEKAMPMLAASATESQATASPIAPSPVDHLLPPGATEVNTAAVGQPTPLPATSLADSLLPPGAAAGPMPGMPGTEVPLPKPQGPLRPVLAPGQTTQPAGLNALKVAGREKEDESLSEIKKLSPEEKARRRFRRNAIMITVCLAILFAVFYYMAQ